MHMRLLESLKEFNAIGDKLKVTASKKRKPTNTSRSPRLDPRNFDLARDVQIETVLKK